MRKLFVITSLVVVFLGVGRPASAIEPRTTAQTLDAKVVVLPALKSTLDNTKINLYLANPLWSTWNLGHGGNWTAQFDTLTNHPRRVYGGAIPWTNNPNQLEQVARSFIDTNQSVLGVANARLTYVPTAATAVKSGRVRYAAFDYSINGVPVEYARLVFAVNNGNMIYWHSANIADVPTVTAPALTATQALTAALAHAGIAQSQITIVRQPTLKLLPQNGLLGALLKYRLTYEMIFRVNGDRSTWVAHVDALTGAIAAFGDSNRYAACTGGTGGKVVGGVRPARANDPEVTRSFPFAEVNGNSTANSNGSFTWDGNSASTGLNGAFFDTNCEDCIKSEEDQQSGFQPYATSTNGRIDLGTGGRDVVLGPDTPTISYGNGTSTPADRTAFFHTNVARQIALKWMNLPFLSSKVPVKVNINDVCNAFWDGTSLNFFKAGELVSTTGSEYKCKNTGEIRDVMQHEWGHGLDEHDGDEPGYAAGLGDMATGEAVADHIALFVDHDACVGQSFFNFSSGPFITDPVTLDVAQCDGVRNVDELRTSTGKLTTTNVTVNCAAVSTAPYYIGPLLGEGHCEGELWGQVDWHLVNNLETGRKYGTVTLDADKHFATYAGDALPNGAGNSPNAGFGRDVAWTIFEQLYFESRPVVASYAPSRFQAQGVSAYDGYMIADDEGDGLANGTPHAAYINDAYVHHGNEEWAPGSTAPSVAADTANCSVPATPNVTLTQSTDSATGTPAVTISWTAVAGATSYSVLRTERKDDVFLEIARLGTASSVTDIGVDNGVTYFYRVQANGGGACFSVSTGGRRSITVGQPQPKLNNISIDDTVGGNADRTLDAGESASLNVVIRNTGFGPLTSVSATLRSLTPGFTVTSTAATSYGTIAINAAASPAESFDITVDPNGALCGTTARFVLDLTTAEGCFAIPVSIELDESDCHLYGNAYASARSIVISNDSLNSCGDHDGGADPGELVQVAVVIHNMGDQPATNVAVQLSSDKPYLSFTENTKHLGTLASNANATATFTFSVGAAPFADLATLIASVTSAEITSPAVLEQTTIVNRDLVTQTFGATFETGNDGWTPSGLWARGMAPTTGDLTQVFASGSGADLCQTLTGPEVEFSSTSSMSFDLAFVTENTPVDGALDGLDVQITLDGGRTWNSVDVTQGYADVSSSTACIGAGSPIFSGVSPLMSRYDVDLSEYAGRVGQLRFRFASDPLFDGPGAWVDNVTTSNVVVSVPDITCQ
jgi:hypothetical protein